MSSLCLPVAALPFIWHSCIHSCVYGVSIYIATNISCSFIFRAHIYDAVELHKQSIKEYSTPDYEIPEGSSGKTPSTNGSKQDIKADRVKLQENPSYVVTNEFS